jgi:hypothetical protein
MRTWMLMIVAVGLLTTLMGCKSGHSHGVCDCDPDNHCYTRTPWPIAPGGPAGEQVHPPTKLPDGKKL